MEMMERKFSWNFLEPQTSTWLVVSKSMMMWWFEIEFRVCVGNFLRMKIRRMSGRCLGKGIDGGSSIRLWRLRFSLMNSCRYFIRQDVLLVVNYELNFPLWTLPLAFGVVKRNIRNIWIPPLPFYSLPFSCVNDETLHDGGNRCSSLRL